MTEKLLAHHAFTVLPYPSMETELGTTASYKAAAPLSVCHALSLQLCISSYYVDLQSIGCAYSHFIKQISDILAACYLG